MGGIAVGAEFVNGRGSYPEGSEPDDGGGADRTGHEDVDATRHGS